jgi:glycosyltransferase involved in cell wall biosynthesis
MKNLGCPRIAVVLSHPIQHFCPQYESWSQHDEWDIRVFFASSAGLETYEDPDYGKEIVWENVELNFPHTFLNEGEVRPINPGLDAPKLESRLADYEPDAVIVYGYAQKLQRRALQWGYERRGVNTLMFSDAEGRQSRAWYRRVAKRALLPIFIYRKVDGFLTVGDANENYHSKYGARPDRLFRLSYPIDRDTYEEAYRNREALSARAREKHDVGKDAFVCSVVGKFVSWKRQKDLIDALRHIGEDDRDVVAFIIGSGEREDRLKQRAERLRGNRVIFPGFVKPDALPKYYAASDAYVHTSSVEPHSVAISESIYMGCPVVLSDRCGSYGPNDDVQPGRNGFVYECGDTMALANEIHRLARNLTLQDRFSQASRNFAVQAQRKSHGEGLRTALTGVGLLSP